jgi:hypothetical protein
MKQLRRLRTALLRISSPRSPEVREWRKLPSANKKALTLIQRVLILIFPQIWSNDYCRVASALEGTIRAVQCRIDYEKIDPRRSQGALRLSRDLGHQAPRRTFSGLDSRPCVRRRSGPGKLRAGCARSSAG